MNDDFNRFLKISFINSCLSSSLSVIGINAMLFSLGKQTNITKNYVYKDIIGTMGGTFIALARKDLDKDKYKEGRKSVVLNQISVCIDSCLFFFPNKYLLFTGTSNILRSVSWIGLGAFNSKCLNIHSKKNDNISELYTYTSICNSIACIISQWITTKIVEKIKPPKLFMAIPILSITQLYVFSKFEKM